MSVPPAVVTATVAAPPPAKPPWRFAAERRLGRLARRLVGVAEAEIPLALSVVGADAVLAAARCDGWALACLERAADCEDGSEVQGAWVLLAASRPTVVRRAILGPPATNWHGGGAASRDGKRRCAGAAGPAVVSWDEAPDGSRR